MTHDILNCPQRGLLKGFRQERADQLAHSHSTAKLSIAMTERYAHATDEGKRRVVDAAGRKGPVVVNMALKKAVGE